MSTTRRLAAHSRRQRGGRAIKFAAVHESLVGTFRTCRGVLTMSAPGGRTDMRLIPGDFRF
jgi:hypothetical protein